MEIAAQGSAPSPTKHAAASSRKSQWLIIALIALAIIGGGLYGYRHHQTQLYIDAVQKETSKANYLFRQIVENPDKVSNSEYFNRSTNIKKQLEDIRLELYSLNDSYKPELKSASVDYITRMRSTVSAIDNYVRADISLKAQRENLTRILPKTKSNSYEELLTIDLGLVNKLTSQEIARVQQARDPNEQLEALRSARESAAVGELIVKHRAAEAAVRRADEAKGQASSNLQQALADLSATGAAADIASGRSLGIGPLRFGENP
jgi:predicted RND superfamily exporter protein